MENWGMCKNCDWATPNDDTWKWSCGRYKTLEDPDEVQDCPSYKPRRSGSSGCWLTTACCVYKGLADDCYELQTLRKFRDEYILELPNGKKLVEEYYSEAPAIVDAINRSENRDELLEETYQKILHVIGTIEAGKNDEAVGEYVSMVRDLSKIV